MKTKIVNKAHTWSTKDVASLVPFWGARVFPYRLPILMWHLIYYNSINGKHNF